MVLHQCESDQSKKKDPQYHRNAVFPVSNKMTALPRKGTRFDRVAVSRVMGKINHVLLHNGRGAIAER